MGSGSDGRPAGLPTAFCGSYTRSTRFDQGLHPVRAEAPAATPASMPVGMGRSPASGSLTMSYPSPASTDQAMSGQPVESVWHAELLDGSTVLLRRLESDDFDDVIRRVRNALRGRTLSALLHASSGASEGLGRRLPNAPTSSMRLAHSKSGKLIGVANYATCQPPVMQKWPSSSRTTSTCAASVRPCFASSAASPDKMVCITSWPMYWRRTTPCCKSCPTLAGGVPDTSTVRCFSLTST